MTSRGIKAARGAVMGTIKPEPDSMKPEPPDFGDEAVCAPRIDIDAIASAKSLGDAMRLLAPQLEGLPRRSRGKYGKRKHLTPEEKAELTRRRNRENARSTRMRRKMYIKHLQQVAETLKARHEELASKVAAPPPDGYTRRREAVRRFFELRSRLACPSVPYDGGGWAEVCAPEFVATAPLTPYRSYATEAQGELRVSRGYAGVDADVQSLRGMLIRLRDRRDRVQAALVAAVGVAAAPKRARPGGAPGAPPSALLGTLDDLLCQAGGGAGPYPTVDFDLDPSSIVHVGDVYMCAWQATVRIIDGETAHSASHTGMSKVRFSPDDRLATIDFRYDVLAFQAVLDALAQSPRDA
ncbi:hypothetical protein M885DRAFT_552658 [Pelagophyceae sp. CCMP2097]|nr:hypothetical protein M885DRAFT_552658 [Pelagophyceae sp. CCMP2097]